MQDQIQAIVTLLSLVNPAICGMMFVQAETGRSGGERLIDASRVMLEIVVILVVAALIGTKMLHLFGVSLDAFMVAGGGVLAWMGFTMLSGEPMTSPPSATGANRGASVTPLILFAASPGTITGVITISAAHTRLDLPVTALVAIAIVMPFTWLVMLLVVRLAGQPNAGGFVRETMTRLMGLIVLSMGVQFALTGYRAFMH